jgi:hypothetical protein
VCLLFSHLNSQKGIWLRESAPQGIFISIDFTHSEEYSTSNELPSRQTGWRTEYGNRKNFLRGDQQVHIPGGTDTQADHAIIYLEKLARHIHENKK